MRASRVSASFLRLAARRLLPVALACQAGFANAYDLTYLKSLLDATPFGGWVQANTSVYGSTRATGASGLPDESYTDPGGIVRAWSSMAWDSSRGQLYLWGGGHANYIGNEMHVWNGRTGTWSLGSLPSRIEPVTTAADPRTYLVVDDAAPQSAHTNDGNLYLPINDYFLTVGDAVYNTGNGFQVRDSQGNLVKAGPWLWDPRKADATKVGGTTGSGYDATTSGGEMWINRAGQWTGWEGPSTSTFLKNTTAYRTENGRDTVYVTKVGYSSGRPDLYRYTLGDVRTGGLDNWELVGNSWNVSSGESTAVIDDRNNLYVQTTITSNDEGRFEIHVWDLGRAGPDNRDVGVHLVQADGTELRLQVGAGSAYNSQDGSIWLWDGTERGTLWRTKAAFNADGSLSTSWLVERIDSTTAAQPDGSFATGVFGKWIWVGELGAFIAMDEYSASTGDAGVWLYKPMAVAAAVPEVNGVWLMMAGLGGLAMLRSRRRLPA